LRLFCFPHACGGRAMFNAWSRALGPRKIHRGGHFYLSDGPQLFAALRRQLSRIGGTQC